MVPACTAIVLAAGLASGPLAPAQQRAEASLRFDLSVPPEQALPLFGPVRESEWSPTWRPRFIAPDGGSNTQEGTVFATGPDTNRSIWILVEYSTERRVIHYAVVAADRTTEIWVRLTAGRGGRSQVRVTERVTALTAGAGEAIAHFEQHFPQQAAHWRAAIEASLQPRGR